jgi:hypothetical protein
MDGCKDGWMDAWVDGGMHGCMDAWMHGCMDGCVDGWMDGWVGGWVAGWVDVWMDGWMDGWTDGCVKKTKTEQCVRTDRPRVALRAHHRDDGAQRLLERRGFEGGASRDGVEENLGDGEELATGGGGDGRAHIAALTHGVVKFQVAELQAHGEDGPDVGLDRDDSIDIGWLVGWLVYLLVKSARSRHKAGVV